jgi:hypothetical protein
VSAVKEKGEAGVQVSITLPTEIHAYVREHAKIDLRSIGSQVLYYVLRGIERERGGE